MLLPVPRVPFREHSSASHSSVGDDDTVTVSSSLGGEDMGPGAEKVLQGESEQQRQRLTKVVATDDEAARLAIEVFFCKPSHIV